VRARHDDVEPPRVGLERNRRQARDRVDGHERARALEPLGDRANVGDDTGRRLRVREEDDFRAAHLRELLADLLGVRSLAPGIAQVHEVAAVCARDRRPALAEVAVRDDEDPVAGRAEVGHGAVERSRTGGGVEEDVVLGAEDLVEALEHPRQDRAELRPPVVDHRRRHRTKHLGRDRCRSRRHEVVLLRHSN
jgi:hypothetical protein